MYLAQRKSVGSLGGKRRNRGQDLDSRSPKGHNNDSPYWVALVEGTHLRQVMELKEDRASGL